MLFQSIVKFQKKDWGDLSDEDKEENNRALWNNEAVLGLYKVRNYEIAIILPKTRDRLEVMMKHELGRECIHQPVLYDSRGIRITK